jgi:pyridinium-3,5-biscarboxylic acid mononucleotide sulfurtransferase
MNGKKNDGAAEAPLDRLNGVIDGIGPMAVAVSGGIDSLTLAQAAHRRLGAGVEMVHAVSPAVPVEATARTRALAEREGWNLRVIDAGEFENPAYVANPLNRCFHCKSALYDGIAAITEKQVVSGANADDLGDFRPGMDAASARGVRHPFVEAGVDKAGVRAIAAALGLGALAELPAAPCLSSRIETGIAVDPRTLDFVHEVETLVGEWVGRRGGAPKTVRCRVRRVGVAVELDPESLAVLEADGGDKLRREVERRAVARGFATPVPFEAYRMGSAFLKDGPA